MDSKNTIFFAVDCQKDFINSDGALPIPNTDTILTQLQLLTQIAEENNIKVVNTADYHTEQSKEISEKPNWVSTFPAHCLIQTEGCDFIDETYPKKFEDNYYIVRYTDLEINGTKFHRARNIIILKDAFDVFIGNRLTNTVIKILSDKQNAVVYGVATDICVRFVVEGLLERNFKVYLVLDAVKGLSYETIESLFIRWCERGVTFTTTKRINQELRKE